MQLISNNFLTIAFIYNIILLKENEMQLHNVIVFKTKDIITYSKQKCNSLKLHFDNILLLISFNTLNPKGT